MCTWKLLTMIRKDRIFSDESSTWVNLIVRTVFTGWIVFAAFSAYVVAVIYFTPEIRDPGMPMLLFGILLVGAVRRDAHRRDAHAAAAGDDACATTSTR